MNGARYLGVRSGEFGVRKLIVSSYVWQIGAIHTQTITKPATSPSSLTHEMLGVHILILICHATLHSSVM